jgi:DNA primase
MNILDAAARIGLVLKRVSVSKGGEYAGPCPKCGGTDRFRVWPADKGGGGSYWCRQPGNGCGAGGDFVQFLVDFCGYQYREAFKEAGREMPKNYIPAGYRAESNQPDPAFKPRIYEDPVETWRIKAMKLVESSHQVLLKNEETLKYLETRGLDLNAVKGFRLGWFPV